MKVSIEFANGPMIVLEHAALRESQWREDIGNHGVLSLLLIQEQRIKLISLAGMTTITFEYEAGDSEYEARLCGVVLHPTEAKLARPNAMSSQYYSQGNSVRLYSQWHPQ